jgi:hypothetical protein
MSIRLIGCSIGRIYKRILVSPPSMIWPANLPAMRACPGASLRGRMLLQYKDTFDSPILLSLPHACGIQNTCRQTSGPVGIRYCEKVYEVAEGHPLELVSKTEK